MCTKEVKEILTQQEIDAFLKDGYSERDLVGLAACKKMIDMGLTKEEMDKTLYGCFIETLEEYAGAGADVDADAVEDMKQYTSFQDMIDNDKLKQQEIGEVINLDDIPDDKMFDIAMNILYDCIIEKKIRQCNKDKTEAEIQDILMKLDERTCKARSERAKRHHLREHFQQY